MLVDGEGAGHGGIHKGHGGFPVTLDEVRELLHLGVAVGFGTGGRGGFCHHLAGLNVDDGTAGGFSHDRYCPGLHVGDTGIGGGHHGGLRPGVHKVTPGGPDLLHCNGCGVVVIFGVGPSKEPGPVVHLPALDGGVGAIRKRHINVKQRTIQAPAILVVFADR